MPSEPDQPMEELLKAYAKKRQDEAGAPLELHPATRRLLQGEVARLRTQPPSGGATWRRLLTGLAPRLAFAGSLLIVLGVVLWPYRPGQRSRDPFDVALATPTAAPDSAAISTNTFFQSRLPATAPAPTKSTPTTLAPERVTLAESALTPPAPNSSQQKDLLPLPAAPAPLPPSAGVGRSLKQPPSDPLQETKTLARNLSQPPLEDRARSTVELSLAAKGPTTVLTLDQAIPSRAFTLEKQDVAVTRSRSQAGNLSAPSTLPLQDAAAAVPAAPMAFSPAAVPTALAGALNETESTKFASAPSQPFRRTASAQDRKNQDSTAAANQVLSSFDFSQSGNRIRIVDADGSVYDGQVIANNPVAASRGAARGFTLNVAAQNTVPFRVSGTNRTANQSLVFEGFFNADPSGAAPRSEPPASATRAAASQAQPAPPAKPRATGETVSALDKAAGRPLPASRIQGNARLGTGGPIPIEARSTVP